MFLVRLGHGNVLKMKKNSKNYKLFAKTQIIEAIKIIDYHLSIMFFLFQFYISTNSTKIILKNNENSLDHV